MITLDSDFYLHVLPIEILPSGDPKTHWINTFMRILMAVLDSQYDYSKRCCQANGDDCGLLVHPRCTDPSKWPSTTHFGMVHTDVTVLDFRNGGGIVDFCSNFFFYGEKPMRRMPANPAKMIYNLFAAVTDEQVYGILKHLRLLSRFPVLLGILNERRIARGELPILLQE